HLLIEKSGGLLAITSISAPRVEKKHAISWIRKVISFIKKAWKQLDVLSYNVFPLIARKRHAKGYKIKRYLLSCKATLAR
ncbi:MAG: hypothetical protein WCE84_05840, partial [Candidatus Rhabdochlamydia sp.]